MNESPEANKASTNDEQIKNAMTEFQKKLMNIPGAGQINDNADFQFDDAILGGNKSPVQPKKKTGIQAKMKHMKRMASNLSMN